MSLMSPTMGQIKHCKLAWNMFQSNLTLIIENSFLCYGDHFLVLFPPNCTFFHTAVNLNIDMIWLSCEQHVSQKDGDFGYHVQ